MFALSNGAPTPGKLLDFIINMAATMTPPSAEMPFDVASTMLDKAQNMVEMGRIATQVLTSG